MAISFCCGFDCSIIFTGAAMPGGILRHWDAVAGAGNISTSTTTVRGSSVKSCRHNVTALGSYLEKSMGGPTEGVARFAIYFASLPSVDTRLCAFIPAAGAFCSLRYENTGTQLVGAFGATGVKTTPYTVVTGRWYVVDMLAQVGSGTRSISVQIMDDTTKVVTDLGSQTSAVAASTITSFRFGSSVSSEIPTVDVFYDDLALSATLGDYPIGDGRVLRIMPAADGAHSFNLGDFKYEDTTNIPTSATDVWQSAGDAGPGSFISQNVINSVGYVECAFDPPPDPQNARALTVYAETRAASTLANTSTLKLNDGGTLDDVYALADFSDPAQSYPSKCYASAPSGGSWTQSKLSALKMRWGYSTDVTDTPYLSEVGLEIEYPPALPVVAGNPSIGRLALQQRMR